jgi:hypothetical protein
MFKNTCIAAIVVLCLSGCSSDAPTVNVGSVVPYSESLQPLIGTWESEGEVALIVERDGDELKIRNPANDTWRFEVADATASGDTIRFVQRHYLISGEPHPFSGKKCNCTISPVPGDPDGLEYIMTTDEMPKGEAEIFRRSKSSGVTMP